MEKKALQCGKYNVVQTKKNKFLNDIKCLKKINTGKTFKFEES